MSEILSIDPKTLSISERHGLLVSAIAPRPIAFVSSVDREGKVNLSPFSFFNIFGSNPPTVVFSPSRSGRDGSLKHTHLNVLEVPEVVINMVNYEMVEQMSLASSAYKRGINEFEKAGFTEVNSLKVKPPRVGEAPVAFECKVNQVIETGTEGASGNLVIATIVQMHIQKQYLDEYGKLDTQKLDLVGRMGGIWYTRASGEALFEVAKPSRPLGIGVDRLPAKIRNSSVLTGNNLGRLGNIPTFPSEKEINEIRATAEVQAILAIKLKDESEKALHKLAQKYIEAGEVQKALMILMIQ